MPTIRPATPLKADGEDMKMNFGSEEKPDLRTLTLGLIIQLVLNARDPDEKLGFEEMCKRGDTIEKVRKADKDLAALDIEPSDVVLIQNQFAKSRMFNPSVAVQLRDLLDPKEKAADDKANARKKAA